MLGTLKEAHVDPTGALHVQMTPDGLVWVPNQAPYGSIVISRGGVRSKYRGIRKFEVLSIAGAVSCINVCGHLPNRHRVERWSGVTSTLSGSTTV